MITSISGERFTEVGINIVGTKGTFPGNLAKYSRSLNPVLMRVAGHIEKKKDKLCK